MKKEKFSDIIILKSSRIRNKNEVKNGEKLRNT